MSAKLGITGSHGFIGRHLVDKMLKMKLNFIEYNDNLENTTSLKKLVRSCEVLIHLAGKNRDNTEEMRRINVDLTANLINLINPNKPFHFIYISSNHVISNSNSEYSKNKRMIEELLKKKSSDTFKVTVLRLPNIYGPRSRPFYNSVVATFCWYKSQDITDKIKLTGDYNKKIGLLNIYDAIDLIISKVRENKIDNYSVENIKRKLKLSPLELKNIISDDKLIENYKYFKEIIDFYQVYNNKDNIMPCNPIHRNNSGLFQELIHSDEIEFGQLSRVEIKPNFIRGGHYHTHKIEWFCVIDGELVLDFYDLKGNYLTTYLLDGNKPAFVKIPILTMHKIRTKNENRATLLIIANEPFDKNNPDTFRIYNEDFK